jgi:arachidonate 15-lipoxygenase
MAELQMELGYLLGTVHYTRLGDYGAGHFADPRVAGPLARFGERIAEAGRLIAERNRHRVPYEHLVPAGIPQSINI